MAKDFIATATGILGRVGEDERRILQNYFHSLIQLLEEDTKSEDPLEALVGLGSNVTTPTNPILLKLLPDAVKDDDDAALELRRLTERSVRQSKVAALRAASLMLDSERLRLDQNEAELFARALNDARIALAAQLNIDSDADHARLRQELVEANGDEGAQDSETELRLATTSLYEFAGGLQFSVLAALEDFLHRGEEQ